MQTDHKRKKLKCEEDNSCCEAITDHEKLEKFDNTSMDAKVWAKEFMRLYNEQRNKGRVYWVDEALMIGWFANAIMAGFDEANRRNKEDYVRKDGIEVDEEKLRNVIGKFEDKYWNETGDNLPISGLVSTIATKIKEVLK